MALQYKVVPRVNPLKRDEDPKFFLSATSREYYELEDLLADVCEDSTIDPDEALLAVNRLFKKAVIRMEHGATISLGYLGHIRLTIRSKGAATSKEAIASNAVDVVPHFVFGKRFRNRIKNISLERIND